MQQHKTPFASAEAAKPRYKAQRARRNEVQKIRRAGILKSRGIGVQARPLHPTVQITGEKMHALV
eukprot:3730682-Pleurochrysis_carterae.AAC.3